MHQTEKSYAYPVKWAHIHSSIILAWHILDTHTHVDTHWTDIKIQERERDVVGGWRERGEEGGGWWAVRGKEWSLIFMQRLFKIQLSLRRACATLCWCLEACNCAHTSIMDRGCGAPRLLVLRRAPIRARPVAGRAPLVLLLFWGGGLITGVAQTALLQTSGRVGWLDGGRPFFSLAFPVRMRGMLVGGWRELGRKQGWREWWWWWWWWSRGVCASDSAITSR